MVNQGTLNAGQGGYLALLASEVRNEGVMTASLGTALLAAGNTGEDESLPGVPAFGLR